MQAGRPAYCQRAIKFTSFVTARQKSRVDQGENAVRPTDVALVGSVPDHQWRPVRVVLKRVI